MLQSAKIYARIEPHMTHTDLNNFLRTLAGSAPPSLSSLELDATAG